MPGLQGCSKLLRKAKQASPDASLQREAYQASQNLICYDTSILATHIQQQMQGAEAFAFDTDRGCSWKERENGRICCWISAVGVRGPQ